MSRKRNPYIPLFTHDIMSSAKCRRLSMRATGLYLWLFCLMNEKPQQGRWALSTNEDHPTWKNSLTYRALQNADKYARLPMFATLMARQFLPWKSGQVLKALQELYRFKLIVVEDDAIIQPRMYRDNGFKLREDTMREYLADDPNDTADDPEDNLAETYRETLKKDGKKGNNKGVNKGTKKDPEKVHGIHARAQLNIESESENNTDNSIGNIGGAGGEESKVGENAQNNPDGGDEVQKGGFKREKNAGMGNLSSKKRKREETPANGLHENGTGDSGGPSFFEFWEAYDKQVNMIDAEAYWGVLSRQDKEAIMEYIPRYKIAQPRKQFRKNPVTFLRMRAWHDEIITDTRTDTTNSNGRQQATTTNQRGGYQGARRTQEQEAADGREQTMRIISRIFADQDAHHQQTADDSARGADTTGDTF